MGSNVDFCLYKKCAKLLEHFYENTQRSIYKVTEKTLSLLKTNDSLLCTKSFKVFLFETKYFYKNIYFKILFEEPTYFKVFRKRI